ncbi:hypothetical protein AB1Y20_005499 [Prymnesium parvum]|uniref:Uncharacterized protein n=1 Tax=Prymnesium parvum TaxID=97485 RepID=A0AB34J4I1_PRYPA
MSKFDPAQHFEKEFQKIKADMNKPSQHASIQPRLVGLLDRYKLKLRPAVHSQRLLEAGKMLLQLGEFAAALRDCFDPVIKRTADEEELGLHGVDALQLRVCAEFGSVEASFTSLMRRDVSVTHSESAETMRALFGRARDAVTSCLKFEKLYWVVFNGTRLIYKMASTLMRPERAVDAIEPLAWCALCMEGMVPLLSLDFLPCRVQLYSALCHCYEAAGMLGAAQKAVLHAKEHLESLQKLDKHDPVPPSPEMRAIYSVAERKYAALATKYAWLLSASEPVATPAAPPSTGKPSKGGKGQPKFEETKPESTATTTVRGVELSSFGTTLEEQLSALLEAMHDYSSTAHPLAHAKPKEDRASLLHDLVHGAFSLAKPSVEAFNTAIAADRTLKDAVAAAEAATAERNQKISEAVVEDEATGGEEDAANEAVESTETVDAVEAALAEEKSARENAAGAQAAADEAGKALPMRLHLELLKACHRFEAWEQVDALLPSARVRTEKALQAVLVDRGAETIEVTVGFGTKPIFRLQESAVAETTIFTESGAHGEAVDIDPESEAVAVMHTETALLESEREIMQAQQAQDSAAELAAMRELAARLDKLKLPPFSRAVTQALPDGLADAAITLWKFVQPILLTNDSLHARQLSPAVSQAAFAAGSSAVVSHRARLSLTITPKTKDDKAKLEGALNTLASDTRSGVRYTMHANGQATIHGSGELALELICDRIRSEFNAASGKVPFVQPSNDAMPKRHFEGAEPSVLTELLLVAHFTLERLNYFDAQLRAVLALCLLQLMQQQRGNLMQSVAIARAAVEAVENARSEQVVRLAEKGICGEPSVSASSVLQHLPDAAPYSSPSDALQQGLACLHAELTIHLIRYELRLGFHRAQRQAVKDHEALRQKQLKRRQQQHIYGVKSRADEARERLEDETGPNLPTIAHAAEEKLQTEFQYDPYSRALLFLEMIEYRTDATEREQLLTQAVELLRSAEAQELDMLRACSANPPPPPKSAQMADRFQPPAPQLLYRTASSICLRPRTFTQIRGPKVAKYAVYGKHSGAGGDVSLNNTDLPGTGEKREVGGGTDQYDQFKGCFTITGLPRGQTFVFAVAAFDALGNILNNAVGRTSPGITTGLPLPRLFCWASLAQQASKFGCIKPARAALAEVERFVMEHGDVPAHRFKLRQQAVANLSSVELRATAKVLLLAPDLRLSVKRAARHQEQFELPRHVHALKLGLQLSMAIADHKLASCAVQQLYNALTPFLRITHRPIVLLHPLSLCHESLRAIPVQELRTIRRAPQLLACVAFEALSLCIEWKLYALATHFGGTDIHSFVAALKPEEQKEAESRPVTKSQLQADADADKLVAQVFTEHVASIAEINPNLAEAGEGGPDRCISVFSALRESEVAAWSALTSEDVAGRPREFEMTVRVCSIMLQRKPSASTAIEIREKLVTAYERAKLSSALLSVADCKGELTEGEPPNEAEDGAEPTEEHIARAAAAVVITFLLRAMMKRLKNRRAARTAMAAQGMWRAYAKIILAQCDALSPPEAESNASDHETESAIDANKEAGSSVLAQYARAVTLAMRADCPVLGMQACAELHNFFTTLPIAAPVVAVFGGFQPMKRQVNDNADPPPELQMAFWMPFFRTSEALVNLLGELRDGAPFGGKDSLSLAIAGVTSLGAGHGEGEDIDNDAASVSTLVRGPKRWFDLRPSDGDLPSLDVKQISEHVLFSLRLLQMGRQWRRQAELALSFDDVTEAEYCSKILPFLEQAQQKLLATKWHDGEALQAVQQRVSTLARDKSKCRESVESWERALHDLMPDDGPASELVVGSGAAENLRPMIDSLRECCSLCRSKREMDLLVRTQQALGFVQVTAGFVEAAAETFVVTIDAIFGKLDVCGAWRDLFSVDAEPISSVLSPRALGTAITTLGMLVLHTTQAKLEARLQFAEFGAALVEALLTPIWPHKDLIEFAGQRLKELPSPHETFESSDFSRYRLLDGLQAIASALLQYDMPLQALPPLVLLKHLATDRCRDVEQAIMADALNIWALSEIGQLDYACQLLAAAHYGMDLPRSATEVRLILPETGNDTPIARALRAPSYSVDAPFDSKLNEPSMKWLMSVEMSEHQQKAHQQHKQKVANHQPRKVLQRPVRKALQRLVRKAPQRLARKALHRLARKALHRLAQKALRRLARKALRRLARKAVELDKSECAIYLRSETALLQADLARRRGLLSAAVEAVAQALSDSHQLRGPTTQAASTLPALRPSPLLWLRLRSTLIADVVQQGQHEVAEDQLQIGMTEAQAAKDKRKFRGLVILRLKLLLKRGDTVAAADGLKLWLKDAEQSIATGRLNVLGAEACMLYASALSALGAAAGTIPGDAGSSKVAALYKQADELLTSEAAMLGLFSRNRLPSLVEENAEGNKQPPNMYLRPLQLLADVKLELANAARLANQKESAEISETADEETEMLVTANKLLNHTQYPRLSLVSRTRAELGRRLRLRAFASREGVATWGGRSTLTSVMDAAATAENTVASSEFQECASALKSAYSLASSNDLVDPELQAAIAVELCLLYGAQLVQGAEMHHLGLCVSFMRAAAAAGKCRRTLLETLPALPSAPIDGGAILPSPLAVAIAEASSMSVQRDATQTGNDPVDSRQVLALYPALLRQRELPQPDADVLERMLIITQVFLRKGVKAFSDAIDSIPLEPSISVDAGLVCLQWHEPLAALASTRRDASRDAMITLLYAVHSPAEGAEDGFLVGQATFLRAHVLEVKSTLAASMRGASSTDTVTSGLTKSLRAIRKLFGKPEIPEKRLEDGDDEREAIEVQALGQEALDHLNTLFDPVIGGEVIYAPLASWLIPVFESPVLEMN